MFLGFISDGACSYSAVAEGTFVQCVLESTLGMPKVIFLINVKFKTKNKTLKNPDNPYKRDT